MEQIFKFEHISNGTDLNGTDFEFWTVFGFIQIFGFEQVLNLNNFKGEQF
jgi:hypothetical protein